METSRFASSTVRVSHTRECCEGNNLLLSFNIVDVILYMARMSVTSLSRSRSRSRSISPTVVQESPLENPALTDSDSESVSVSILDSCGAELASGHVNVAATDGSASQSPANSPVLPIVVPTAVKSPPPQIPARSAFGLSSTACNAYSWAINRIAGNPPDPHAPFPFIGPNPCLLYTSPSPRDRTRSRMPSSA